MKFKTITSKVIFFIAGIFISGFATAQCQASFSYIVNGMSVSFNNNSTGASMPTYYWAFGDSQTSFVTNPYHTYSSNGWYAVCLTMVDSLSGCQSTYCDSVQINNVSSGISEAQNSSDFHAWPNPAADQVTVSSGTAFDGIVRITGISGAVIREQKMTGTEMVINTSDLPAGSYFISGISGGTSWNQRIVVIH